MRIAAALATPIRAIALLPAARIGHGREELPREKAAPHHVAAPVDASAAFLAQAIAQELYPDALPPEAARADAYLPRPRAAFEGLNFRAIA
jgi:hypothetical protein